MIRTEYSQALEVRQTAYDDRVEYTAVFKLDGLTVIARGSTHEHALATLAIRMGRALSERIKGSLAITA